MMIAPKDRPPADPESLVLVTRRLDPGDTWLRFVRAIHPDPLGVGHGAKSRFADSALDRGELVAFEPVYFVSTFRAAFVETVLRDAANGKPSDWPMAESELSRWTCVQVAVTRPLVAVNLTGPGPVRMRMPSDAARARDQTLGRLWSSTIHAHPARVDGILYPSRLVGDECLCLYASRVIDAVQVMRRDGLLNWPGDLADAFHAFGIVLIGL